MSYQAIARKWRPTSFEAIAGQSHVTRTLKNAISLGRIHHAFLFTGARGVGKTSAARVLARALDCVNGPTADPCGVCPSCTEILTGSCPDVIEIDGASNNSVDDIRELRDSVRYLPVRGKYKVYIIDEVHMLTKGAFNALLKTLEEPPAHVIFIFATTEPQKIPDTILSRVQRFDFKRIPLSVVVDRLKEVCAADGVDITDAGLRLIARAGEGSMRDAQSLLDQVISFGGQKVTTEQVADILGLVDRALLYAMLEGILRGDADRCLEAIASVYNYGYELSEFTSELLELLRNATLVGLSPSSKRFLDVGDEERAQLEAVVSGVSSDVLVRAFQVVLEVHEQVSRAARPRLVLEMAVARLVAIRPARPMEHLVERIVELERRLRGSRPRGSAGSGSAGPGPAAGGGSAPPPRGSSPPPSRGGPPPGSADAAPAAPAAPVEAAAAPAQSAPGAAADRDDLPADLPDAERFRLFQAWIDGKGITYAEWARHAVLVEVARPLVRVAFADERYKRVATDASDAVVTAGIQRFFPGCTTAAVGLRASGSAAKTRDEQEREAYEAHKVAVRKALEASPALRRVTEALGATWVDLKVDRQPAAP